MQYSLRHGVRHGYQKHWNQISVLYTPVHKSVLPILL